MKASLLKMDIVKLFKGLTLPPSNGDEHVRFSTTVIPGAERCRLAVDKAGMPCMLISSSDTSHVFSPPLVLRHIQVQHGVLCRTSGQDGSIDETNYTIIQCVDRDESMREYFLRVMGSVATYLGHDPTPETVGAVVARLADLFHALTLPSRKSLQGLWAELFVIAQSRDVATMVRCWHSSNEEHFDFSDGTLRIEVKSAAGRIRCHHFSLTQLCPPSDAKVLIASIFVEPAGGGVSLDDLCAEVKAKLENSPELLLRLDQVVAATLGRDWRFGQKEKFDRQVARDTLAFYDAQSIPKVSPYLPSGVSDVRFKSDLSEVSIVEIKFYRTMGALFKSVMR
jgi:hypothetical protein